MIKIEDESEDNPFVSDGEAMHACRFVYDSNAAFPLPVTLPHGIEITVPSRLDRAVAKRKAEFVAGRFCAMRALGRLTGYRGSIGLGPNGEPLWPPGTRGSITHGATHAAAIVTADPNLRGIGLDREATVARSDVSGIGHLIMSAHEMEAGGDSFPPAVLVTLVFSAKEALYKAIYPLARRFVDFAELEFLGFRDGTMRFRPAASLHIVLNDNTIQVAFQLIDDGVLTLCRIRAGK
jgi:enterobactin synthetase component D